MQSSGSGSQRSAGALAASKAETKQIATSSTVLSSGALNMPYPPVLTLPTELLRLVATGVESDDLPNLRLVCKRFCGASNKMFGKQKLARRRFVVSEHSLRNLSQLTAHPDFGPCVQSIHLGTNGMKSSTIMLLSALERKGVTNEMQKMQEFFQYRVAAQTHNDFCVFGQAHYYVTKILRNLIRHGRDGRQVVIGIFEDGARYQDSTGCKTLKGYGWDMLYGSLPLTAWSPRTARTLHILQDTLLTTGFVPKSLELRLSSSYAREPRLDALESELQGFIRSGINPLRTRLDVSFSFHELAYCLDVQHQALHLRGLPSKQFVYLYNLPNFNSRFSARPFQDAPHLERVCFKRLGYTCFERSGHSFFGQPGYGYTRVKGASMMYFNEELVLEGKENIITKLARHLKSRGEEDVTPGWKPKDKDEREAEAGGWYVDKDSYYD